MGSRSNSKNNSTKTNNTQMSNLQRNNPATTMAAAQGNQQALQSSLMEQVMPALSAFMEMGQQQMADNPMMPSSFKDKGENALSLQDRFKLFSHLYSGGERDEFMDAQKGGVPINDAMQLPQQPQQPQPGQVAPQMNFNPQMGNLTPQQQAGLFGFNPYGGNGRR
jgi:hypothetical protein